MNKQPQPTPAQRKESIEELSQLEAAAAALREQFLAKFRQIRADSAAYFRKEMAFWPTTKRLTRMDPKEKFWIVPDDAQNIRWMRDVFARCLDALGSEIGRQDKMEKFVNDLRLMRSDIEWVKRETAKIWPLLRKQCLLWAQAACDGQAAGGDWRAPGWLDNWPADLPPKALLVAAQVKRLDADRTGRVLKEIESRVKHQLGPVQKGATDELTVRLAQEKESARQARRPAKAEAPEPAAQSTRTADAPREFDGLDQKDTELSQYFDAANLTSRQCQCASMKWEYGLPNREIARRLGLHHKTVQEYLHAVGKRLERDQNFKRKLKERIARHGSHDQLA